MAIQKITADVISSDAITTASISDSAITAAKLAGTLDLTGKTITVATASSGDNDTSPASTAFVQQEISALVDSSPDALNTLNELAAALGDDANFSTTVTNSIATKLPLAGGTMTGALTVNSGTANTSITTSSSDAANWMTMTDPSGSIFFGNSGANYQLWVGAAKQLEVTSSAATFTGTVVADGLTVDGDATLSSGSSSNLTLSMYAPDTGYNSSIFLGRSATRKAIIEAEQIDANSGHNLNFYTNANGSDATKRATISKDGDISFYEDTGTTAKLFWDASEERLGIGTTSPSSELHVDSNNTDTTITIESDLDGSSLFTSGIDLKRETVSKGSRIESIRDASAGGVGLNFLTTADNAAEVSGTLTSRMVILEDGNVGIGETNPQDPLHLTAGSSDEVTTFRVSTAGALTLSRNHAVSPSITTNMGSGIPKLQLNRNSVLETQINAYGDSWFAASGVGDVGIGTNSPAAKLDILNTADTNDFILTNDGNDTNMSMFSYRNSSNHNIIMAKAARGTLASPATIAEDESMLRIIARGYNSGDGTYNPSAEINFAVDGEPSSSGDASDMPGRIEFLTAPDGTDSESIRMTIKNDGNVGIGTDSPSSTLTVHGTIESSKDEFNSSNEGGQIMLRSPSNTTTSKRYSFDTFNVSSASVLRLISEDDSDGANGVVRMALDTKGTHYFTNGTSSYAHNTYAHAAVFSRNSTPGGTVVIEDSDVSSGIGNTVLTCYLRDQAPTSSASFIRFDDGGGTVGTVRHNADGSITFNDTSDYRLKENVDYDWNALALVGQLKPAKFNFIKAPGKTKQGFLAHEVMDIVPGSVTGEKDHMEPIGTITDSDGNLVDEGVYEHFCKEGQIWTQTGEEPIYQELDYSKLVPLLTKAIQEQQTIIDDLKSRIETLEG